ncbi:MAG: SPFH domain-containing protein [Candidatus Moranbacteria bacterium]|nr:SPFH domain-containing protein [Candidatus Moranbacteria bacterium]
MLMAWVATLVTPQGSWWAYSVFGSVGAAASIWYFGWEGLRTVQIGFTAVPLFLGKRVAGKVLTEGLVWYWPKPFGNIQEVDAKKRSIDQEVTEILSKDDVPIKIDLSSEVQVVDPQRYLGATGAEDLYKQGVDGILRLIVSKLNSEVVPRSKVGIVHVLINGTLTGEGIPGVPASGAEEVQELEEFAVEGIQNHALTEWGIKLNRVRITTVRLPVELEAARANVRVEYAQQEAESKETETVIKQMKRYKESFPNLSDAQIATIVQAERGKRQAITIDGNASPLEKAGALAGNITNEK